MLNVPLSAKPSQTFGIILGGQSCTINIYAKSTGLFADLFINNVAVIVGVLCLDCVLIVRDAYLGFIGDLAFYDTQGSNDPVYTGLGTRYVLIYIEASDYPS